MSSSKRPKPHALPPDFRSRDKEAMRRDKRIIIQFNDKEFDALKRYQKLIGASSRSSICREAIMEKVLEGLSENQPTLF